MLDLGPRTSYPASERCPELRQPLARGDGIISPEKPYCIVITRPEGMSNEEWTAYHCAELSRLRQERNRRGDVTPLNRGKVEVERVAVVRG